MTEPHPGVGALLGADAGSDGPGPTWAGAGPLVLESATTGLCAVVEGEGPAVVLVHGVGVGPSSFAAVASLLHGVTRVVTVHRPGYGLAAGCAPASVGDQVASLVEVIDRLDERPAVLVGVSGGATLGLLTATAPSQAVSTVVVHEPLIGPGAPLLHTAVLEAADRLGADPDPAASARFLAALVGDHSWANGASSLTASALEHADALRAEVPEFTRVAFDDDAMARLGAGGVALHTSVGVASGPARQEVAAVLAERAGATVHVVDGAGHLAQLDAPGALVDLVLSLLGDRTPGRPR